MRYLVASLIFFQHTTLYCQLMLDREISIHVKSMPLDEVLNKLQNEYYISFSYGFDNIKGRTLVSVESDGISVYKLIQELARQADLQFILIGTTIVFRRACKACANRNMLNTASVWKDGIADIDSVHLTKRIQRVLTTPLLPVPVAWVKYIPITIPTDAKLVRNNDVAPRTRCRIQMMLQYDSKVHSAHKNIVISNHQHNTLQAIHHIGLGVAYQLSSRTYLEGSMAGTLIDFARRPIDKRKAEPIYSELGVGWRFAVVRTNKTIVWWSASLSCSNVVRSNPVTYRHQGHQVYMPFTVPSLESTLYSGAMSVYIDYRLDAASALLLKCKYGLLDVHGPSELAPTYTSILSLSIGFRYTVFPHCNPGCQ
jgi:hypothetical protein